MSEPNGDHTPRMDRIEKALDLSAIGHEQFRQLHKHLLISQAANSELIAENGGRIVALLQRLEAESIMRKETDTRLDARVDQLCLRHRPVHRQTPAHVASLTLIMLTSLA